jgi:hypothetical protein
MILSATVRDKNSSLILQKNILLIHMQTLSLLFVRLAELFLMAPALLGLPQLVLIISVILV